MVAFLGLAMDHSTTNLISTLRPVSRASVRLMVASNLTEGVSCAIIILSNYSDYFFPYSWVIE